MSPKTKKDKKGFTLIELLVVVLIIGILSAIALPQYFKALDKARFVQVLTFRDAIVRAEQSYYLLNNEYTTNMSALDVDIPNIKNYPCSLEDLGTTVSATCYLKKNNKPFIVLKKYSSGQEFCCSWSYTNFAGDDLCKSVINTNSLYNSGETFRCYKKKR